MTSLNKAVRRKSGTPAAKYGPDARRELVITLRPGAPGEALIELTPLRSKRTRAITCADLWSYLERCAANKAWAERMAKKKSAKAAQREKSAQRRHTAKLRREVKLADLGDESTTITED